MSTSTPGSSRAASDTTQIPSTSPPHDAPQHNAPQHVAEGAERHAPGIPAQKRAGKPPSTNLHLPRSPLIGRDHEVAAIQNLLLQDQVGLLTLTGPGGIGKTRLALQVAVTMLDHFVDGVYFVSLAPIRDAALVSDAVAQTLEVRGASGRPILESLQDYLQHRQMLLVLDNFEQVVAAAPLVAVLLAECHRLKILVTSRATLHLYGEQEFPVPPLALPDLKRLSTMGAELVPSLAQYAAVALFVQRAVAVKPDFTLTETNAMVIAEICIGLDGLPLAVELAAAKLKLFSPPALLARLQQRLTLLTNGPHDLPARQRTLRDEIAWSYDLLAPGEQILFRRLAVFVGGFTLEAAQAVCNAAGDLGVDVFDGVALLVDQNLLKQAEQVSPGGEYLAGMEPRFDMLETVREYGLELLVTSGEIEAIRRQHVSLFLALAEKAAPLTMGANQSKGIAMLEADHDNVRTALAWSLVDIDGTEIALRFVEALQEFWIQSGHGGEGLRWSEAALARTTEVDHTEARASALVIAGCLAVMQGDHQAGRTRLEAGRAIAKEIGARQSLAISLTCLSWIAHAQHDNVLTVAQLEEASTIFRELGDKFGLASTRVFLGNAARDEHDYARAQSLYEEGLALFQEIGADFDAADVLSFLGQLFQAQGDQARADEFFRESLARWQAMGTLQWKGVINCLDGLAGVCAAHRQFEVAAHLLGAADALLKVILGSPSPHFPASAEDTYAPLRAELGDAEFAAAWATGRSLSVEEAVHYVLALPIFSEPLPDQSSSQLSSSVIYSAGLTAREVEVLRLLAQGLTYAQIAEMLIISRRTVNAHVISIYSKLGVNSRLAATRFAQDHQLV
jgi:predicted ATPase/DNA-binding CsgD family transcriptional regulator/tetratricopeptide (TPR) repeat protein